MKKIIYFFIIYLFISCAKDTLNVYNPSDVPEGLPVTLRLKLDYGQMEKRSGFTPSQEQTIKSAHVLVFNSSGLKVSSQYISGNVINALSNVEVKSGAGMSVYVLANLTAENMNVPYIEYAFANVNTINDLKAVKLYNLATDINQNRSLIMYGWIDNQTLNPNVTKNINLTMYFAPVRATLYVTTELTNPLESFTLTDWEIMNYPKKSFLLPNSSDAGTSASDFNNSITSLTWVDTVINSKPAKYAFMYMFENRRGGRVGIDLIPDTNPKNKAKYAPSNATAIVIKGLYTSLGIVKSMQATIYLGSNSYDNYDVVRGNDYSFFVTVKGFNDILTDSRVTSDIEAIHINLFNSVLDCHPDRRPLQIITLKDSLKIEVVKSDGTPAPSNFWLKLSNINLNAAVSLGGGLYGRPTYNVTTDMLTTLSFTFPAVIGNNQNVKMIYMYADENDSETSRTAQIKIYTSPNNTLVQTIPITQLGYQTMGRVGLRAYAETGALNAADDYVLAVENIEEASLNLTPGITAGTEALSTMQWGYNQSRKQSNGESYIYYYNRNGYNNTLKLVCDASFNLLPAFGRISAVTSLVASVNISEQFVDPIYNTNAARYCFEKNRDLDGDGKISNPNTKGVNEIVWFLPSTDELYQMYIGQYSLPYPLANTNYQSSTEFYDSPKTKITSINYATGSSVPITKFDLANVRCVKKVRLSSQTEPNSPYLENNTLVINNKGFKSTTLRTGTIACPTPVNVQSDNVNQYVSGRFRVSKNDCRKLGNTGLSTMTWAEANGWSVLNNSLSTSGVLASTATGCNAYSESGYPAGKWRVPTQREMMIIMELAAELESRSDFNPLNKLYWCSTQINATSAWYADMTNIYMYLSLKAASNVSTRCIYDLP